MILFLDLETTGLNPNCDDILEVAAVLMEDDLTEVSRFQRVVFYPSGDRCDIDQVVEVMHTNNGLWLECSAAPHTIDQVDDALADWMAKHGAHGAQLAGNSIHFDRAFMATLMPKSLQGLHYRQIDVSSLNEIARRFAPSVYSNRPQDKPHRAMADIENSVAQLRYYLDMGIS